MRRREFVGLVGGVLVGWPLAARGQPDRVRRISLILPLAENDPHSQLRVSAFRQALHEMGWIDGRNMQIDYRWGAGDAARFKAIAAELVRLAPEVIVATGMPALEALRDETRAIPIIFLLVVDPVGTGLTRSLTHPGGNFTGFTSFESSMVGKWLSLFKDIAPSVTRVALIFNPQTTPFAGYLNVIEQVAPSFGIEPTISPVQDGAELGPVIDAFAAKGHGGLVVLPSPITLVNRERIIELASQYRLPAIYPYDYFARSGGLLSYGIDVIDLYRRSASYVDRILKGERAGDLPVQQPTKFELVINAKTARALGLTISPSLLARADEVIE